MVEAIPRGPWDERDAAASMRWNKRRALLRGAIDIGRKKLSMPMQLLRRVRLIVNVDRDWLAFFEAKQWPGELTVIGSGGDDVFRRQFHRRHGDGQGVIGRAANLGSDLFWLGHCGLLASNGLAK